MYTYAEPEKQEFELLPEGEYDFVVADLHLDFETNEKGNFGGIVKLAVGPDRKYVFAGLYAGTSAKGKKFDMIAPFLKAIKKDPGVGKEPDLSRKSLLGSKGKAVIKIGEYLGRPKNEVNYFIYEDNTNPIETSEDDFPAATTPISRPVDAPKKKVDNLAF